MLRKKGAKIEKLTPEVSKLISDMFETMRAAQAWLAAQQIGEALQVTVIDVRGMTDRPSTLELNGEVGRRECFMPLVLINPEVKPYGETGRGTRRLPEFPGNFCGHLPPVEWMWRP